MLTAAVTYPGEYSSLNVIYSPPVAHLFVCVCVCVYMCVFISVCNNKITMEGVEILAGALCSHNNLTEVHIRYFLFLSRAKTMDWRQNGLVKDDQDMFFGINLNTIWSKYTVNYAKGKYGEEGE